VFLPNPFSAPRSRHSHPAARLTRASLLGGTALVVLIGAGGGAWAQVKVGVNAQAAVSGVAIGDGAIAGYQRNPDGSLKKVDDYVGAVAIGAGADVESRNGIAVGAGAAVGSGGGVAIGGQTNSGVAIGGNAFGGYYGGAASVAGSAIGSETVAFGIYSQAGYRVAAKKGDNEAYMEMDGNYYVDLGMNATALGARSLALGGASVAIGKGSVAAAASSVAIGIAVDDAFRDGKGAYGVASVAIGQNAIAGIRRESNSKDGVLLQDGKYYTFPYNRAIAFGAGANAQGNSVIAFGSDAITTGDNSIAIGTGAHAFNGGIALGLNSTTDDYVKTNPEQSKLALPDQTYGAASISNAFAGTGGTIRVLSVGNSNTYSQIQNVAAGRLNAGSTDAVNGSQLWAVMQSISGGGGGGAGSGSPVPTGTSSGANALALGTGSTASQANSVALGANSATRTANASSSINLRGTNYNFAGQATSSTNVVSVGAVGAERQIQNVAAGLLSSDSTDAVNGSQLYATNQAVNSLTNVLGGVTGQVGSATGANATAYGTGSVASAANSTAMGAGANASTANSVALGANSTTGAAVAVVGDTVGEKYYAYQGAAPVGVVSVGSAGSERQVQNVAAGRVAANSTDAVNGSQLWASNQAITVAMNQSLDSLGASINQVNNRVGSVQKEARGGVAAAVALVNAPMPSAPGKTSWAGNVAKFKDQYAMGVSFSHRLNSNIPLAMTAGFAYTPGTSDVTGRFGMAGEF
jgi:hypothetical protein